MNFICWKQGVLLAEFIWKSKGFWKRTTSLKDFRITWITQFAGVWFIACWTYSYCFGIFFSLSRLDVSLHFKYTPGKWLKLLINSWSLHQIWIFMVLFARLKKKGKHRKFRQTYLTYSFIFSPNEQQKIMISCTPSSIKYSIV